MAACFAIFGASSGGTFALFSLQQYAPAVLFGATGRALFLVLLIDTALKGLNATRFAGLAMSSLLSSGGRLEAFVGMLGATLLYIALLGFPKFSSGQYRGADLRHALLVLAASVVPTLSFLLLYGQAFGEPWWTEVLGGYGLAAATCPWWPSGFSVFAILVALLTAISWISLLQGLGGSIENSAKLRILIGGVMGALVWIGVSFAYFEAYTAAQTIKSGLMGIGYFLVSTNNFLLPFQWLAFACAGLAIWKLWRRKFISRRNLELCLLSGAVLGVTLRSLFAFTFNPMPQTTPVAYLPLFVLVPLVFRENSAWLAARHGYQNSLGFLRRSMFLGVLLLLAFAGLRSAAYLVRERGTPYETLRTAGGEVRVSDAAGLEIHRHLSGILRPNDTLADMAYGGGIQIAFQRKNPLFTTQFVNFRPGLAQRTRDAEQLRANPARFVLAWTNLQGEYGKPAFACPFPSIPWRYASILAVCKCKTGAGRVSAYGLRAKPLSPAEAIFGL